MNFADRKLQDGRAAVVRNGHLPQRDIQTGIGTVRVKIPKVRSRDGSVVTFRSALVPPYVRKSASLEAALPWLYLKGLSTGEMAPALEVLAGPEARGLSTGTVSRLKRRWTREHDIWRSGAGRTSFKLLIIKPVELYSLAYVENIILCQKQHFKANVVRQRKPRCQK